MVDCMDQGIGRLIETLKKNGQFENTLILFLQDNGGCSEGMGRNRPFLPRAEKPSLPAMANDALQPAMIPKQTRDGFPVRQGGGVLPGAADTFLGYGMNWANVSNTPFREYKHWVHEGGISTPLIAHWPAAIQTGTEGAAVGRLDSTPAHLIDVMATCVDLAGATYPQVKGGNPVPPMEGVSLAPVFSAKPVKRPNPLFWEHEGNRAIRAGDWKLVSKHSGEWELYDMAADRTEMNNLSTKHPEQVGAMAALWQSWAERIGVKPWPLGGARRTAKKEKPKP
jgi:arylsulfatase